MLRRLSFMREHLWAQRRLNDYVDGDLRERERHRFEEHVGRCPECRRVLGALKRTIDGLMSLARPPAPAGLAPDIVERLRAEDPTG
jgi:anti-sigma factor RsiW